jgi:hypothetical protein
MWLTVEKLRRSSEGKEAEARFRQGVMTEVSTGYFAARHQTTGMHRGTSYGIEQSGIIPDHIAILVDEIGACSIEGGCGAPRLNTRGDMDPKEKTFLSRILALLTMSGVTEQGEDGDDAGDEDASGGDPDPNTANNDGADGSEADSGDDGGSGDDDADEDELMNEQERADLVARLLNSTKLSLEEEQLTAMTDDQLNGLAQLAGCGCGDGDASADGGEGPAALDDGIADDGDEGSPVANSGGLSGDDMNFVRSLRELSGGTVEGLTSLIEAGKAEAERRETQRVALVKALEENDQCAASKATLNSMSLEVLEAFDRSLSPLSYAGRGGARVENRDEQDLPPAPPAVFGKED